MPSWVRARLGCTLGRYLVRAVFVRVMRTHQDPALAEKGARAQAGVHALGRGAAGPARTLLLFAVKQKHEGSGSLGLAWPQFVKPGDGC